MEATHAYVIYAPQHYATGLVEKRMQSTGET